MNWIKKNYEALNCVVASTSFFIHPLSTKNSPQCFVWYHRLVTIFSTLHLIKYLLQCSYLWTLSGQMGPADVSGLQFWSTLVLQLDHEIQHHLDWLPGDSCYSQWLYLSFCLKVSKNMNTKYFTYIQDIKIMKLMYRS